MCSMRSYRCCGSRSIAAWPGYEDTNDALRLARDSAMQAVVGSSTLRAHRGNRMKKIGKVLSFFEWRSILGLFNGYFGPPN